MTVIFRCISYILWVSKCLYMHPGFDYLVKQVFLAYIDMYYAASSCSPATNLVHSLMRIPTWVLTLYECSYILYQVPMYMFMHALMLIPQPS